MTTTTENQELVDQLQDFLRDYYHEEVLELANIASDGRPHALTVDWMDLYQSDPDLADDLTNAPGQIKENADEALRLYDVPVDVSLANCHVRFDLNQERSVASTRAHEVGDLMGLYGQVGYITTIKPMLDKAAFECQRCGTITRIPQNPGSYQEPHECQGCERQGPFQINIGQSQYVDYQKLKLKQPPEETKGGTGATIEVRLTKDLVDSHDDGELQAGNKVHITGQYQAEQQADDSPVQDEYLTGEHIDVLENDFSNLEIDTEEEQLIREIAHGEHGNPYELLLESIVPDHYGDEEIKLALTLQMCRGVEATTPDGSHQRGDIHVLLLGDPGTGKSSMMRRISEVAPRSSYASGKGTSAAGLIAAAVPSEFGDEKWDIEAGALVLANQGVAAIDEIDKMDEETVSAMHDALESPQLAEIDKADKHVSLPARTSLTAAGNPKYGRFDHYEPFAKQIDLPPALLSRFDLMFMLTDQPDEEEDRMLSEKITRRKRLATVDSHRDGQEVDAGEDSAPIETDLLRKYFSYVRQHCYPTIPESLEQYISSEYTELRSQAYNEDDDKAIPVTARKNEGIIRLAEASARIELRDTVSKSDVDRAVKLIRECLRQTSQTEDGEFDADITEASVSTSQRKRIRIIRELIDELEDEHEDGAPIELVVEQALNEHHIPSAMTENQIEEFKMEGEAYSPDNDDHVRLT